MKDIIWYLPCQPHWLCKPSMSIFAFLLLMGLIRFIRILYLEYQKNLSKNKIRRLRKLTPAQRERLKRRKAEKRRL